MIKWINQQLDNASFYQKRPLDQHLDTIDYNDDNTELDSYDTWIRGKVKTGYIKKTIDTKPTINFNHVSTFQELKFNKTRSNFQEA